MAKGCLFYLDPFDSPPAIQFSSEFVDVCKWMLYTLNVTINSVWGEERITSHLLLEFTKRFVVVSSFRYMS